MKIDIRTKDWARRRDWLAGSAETFGRISCDIILSVSSKRKRLEARKLAVIFISIPFTRYAKTSFTE